MLHQSSGRASSLSRALFPAIQPVWITDSVLAHAFQRFCRVRRRHGSNVPGPLESRRRASKRRNTNLASNNGSAAPSPAILFSKEPTSGWWQTQTDQQNKPSQPILPSWLLYPSEPSADTQLQPATSEDLTPRKEYASLTTELKACKSVEEIYSIINRRGIDLHRNPIGINILMSYVGRDSTWRLGEVVKYLTDPRMNPLGTRNYSRLMSVLVHVTNQISGRFRSLEAWQIIHQALCKAVRLGLVSSDEFGRLVLALPAIKFDHGSNGFETLSDASVDDHTVQLFQSLNASAVLSIGDLSVNLRQTLLRRTAIATISATVLELRLLLHQFPLDDVNLLEADFIISWLFDAFNSTSSGINKTIADYLQALPQSLLLTLIPRVTEHLFSAVKKDECNAPAFALWNSVLGCLKTSRTQDSPFSNDDFQICRQGFSKRLTSVEVTLLSHFLAHAIHRGEDDRLVDDFDYKDNIRKSFQPDPAQPLDWLEDTINGLKYIPVSNHKAFLFKIARTLRASLEGRAGPAPVPGLNPEPFFRQALSRLSDDVFYGCAKIVFKGELVTMCNSLTANLDTFARVVGKITDNEETEYRFFKRALSHSTIFFLGLQQSRKNRQQWREVLLVDQVALVYSKSPEATLANIFRSRSSDVGRLLPPPQSFLEVIDRVAVYIAMNERVPPQQAFNRVRNWWRYLRQNRSPVSPMITRALWHAGVARQGHEGCSTTQLRWVFQQIRYVEGKEVAQTLMRDPGFRTHRRMMLEDQLAEIEHTMGADIEGVNTSRLAQVDLWGNPVPPPPALEGVSKASESAPRQARVPVDDPLALEHSVRQP